MGTISKRHQVELDAIADKAVDAWQWAIGQDFNPGLLDEEDLSEAYKNVFEAVRDDLDRLAKRVGSVGHSESYLRGSLFPKIWITLANRGVFYDLDYDAKEEEYYGEVRLSKPKDLRSRLLRRKTDAARLYRQWTTKNSEEREVKRKKKQSRQVRWNQDVVDQFNELAAEAIQNPTGTFKEQMGQRLVGLQWFLGRRAWSELAYQADFKLVDGPEWADGWFIFSGHSKKTLKEKDGDEAEKKWAIPIFGIDPEILLEAFQEFRVLEADQPWFDQTADESHKLVQDALFYSTEKVLRSGFAAEAMKPIHDAGYEFHLTMHRFRDLYVSRGFWYEEEWAKANGKSAGNIQIWAATYLGHFGKGSEKDTGEYLKLNFLGPDPIPPIF